MEDALVQMSRDITLQAAFNSKTLVDFWISLAREYTQLPQTTPDSIWLHLLVPVTYVKNLRTNIHVSLSFDL
uniref:Uncharacterized protein n=1 Tax=Lepeophtheirus salmonis TaxID=72036 RepID=A0A0K2UIK7_LEPSM